MSMYRRMRSLVSVVVLVVLWGTPGHARYGERPNRIAEAAPYNVTEAEVAPPPSADQWPTREGVVAQQLLGHVADTDRDSTRAPCVLQDACDGRQPTGEPAVVDGIPPVPRAVTHGVRPLPRTPEATPPTATPSPVADATDVYEDVVVKVGFSAPVTGLDATTWTLTDAQGTAVPASVAQIGEATWGLFPHQVVLRRGETYTARVAAAVCDFAKNCLRQALTWRFTITPTPGGGQGEIRMPLGGGRPAAREETQAIIRPTAPGETPVAGPPPPDAALPTPTQTARP